MGTLRGATVTARYRDATGTEVQCSLEDCDPLRVAGGLPVRVPPSYRGQRHYPGLFWSATNDGHVVYESLLELAWLWLADFDRDVVRVAAQPLHMRDPRSTRSRYPDFLTVSRGGAVSVIDVKAPGLLDKPGAREALAWTGEMVRIRGWRYEVWTGPDLVALRNVQMIATARRRRLVDSSDVASAVRLCGDGARLADLERSLARAGTGTPARLVLFRALWTGDLSFEISAPLSPETWLEPAA